MIRRISTGVVALLGAGIIATGYQGMSTNAPRKLGEMLADHAHLELQLDSLATAVNCIPRSSRLTTPRQAARQLLDSLDSALQPYREGILRPEDYRHDLVRLYNLKENGKTAVLRARREFRTVLQLDS